MLGVAQRLTTAPPPPASSSVNSAASRRHTAQDQAVVCTTQFLSYQRARLGRFGTPIQNVISTDLLKQISIGCTILQHVNLLPTFYSNRPMFKSSVLESWLLPHLRFVTRNHSFTKVLQGGKDYRLSSLGARCVGTCREEHLESTFALTEKPHCAVLGTCIHSNTVHLPA